MGLIRNINITTITLFANKMKSIFSILFVFSIILPSSTYANTNFVVKKVDLFGIKWVGEFEDSLKKKVSQKGERKTANDSLTALNCNHADTLSLIYKSVTALLEYQQGMDKIKKINDSISLKNKELTIEIGNINKENLSLTQEKINLNTTNKNLELERNSSQQKLQNIDGQLSSMVSTLNQSSYQTDPKIIEAMINIAKEQNNLNALNSLRDFQTKSKAIKEANSSINGQKILNVTDIETLANYLKTAYGTQNTLFSQLHKDYQQTLNLINNYSETACVLQISLQNALIDYKLAPREEKIRLLRESIADVYQYDRFVAIIEDAIKTIPTANPVQINCD